MTAENSISNDIAAIRTDAAAIRTDAAVTRERVDQLDKRFDSVNKIFLVYSSIIGILLFLMGWGIFSLRGEINSHTTAIASLQTVVEERSKQQVEKIDGLTNQVNLLKESFDEAPSTIIKAAEDANKATSELVRHVSTLNEMLEQIRTAAVQLGESTSGPPNSKEFEAYVGTTLGNIEQLLKELKEAQGQR